MKIYGYMKYVSLILDELRHGPAPEAGVQARQQGQSCRTGDIRPGTNI